MASRARSGARTPIKRPEGEIRQSQMVTTYGPGSMVDLVNCAVVIGGLEHWGYGAAGFVALKFFKTRPAAQLKRSAGVWAASK